LLVGKEVDFVECAAANGAPRFRQRETGTQENLWSCNLSDIWTAEETWVAILKTYLAGRTWTFVGGKVTP